MSLLSGLGVHVINKLLISKLALKLKSYPKNIAMKIVNSIFLLLLFQTLSSQTADGYWDKDRITTKEIKVAAGEKITIKSEDFPTGTTEIVYRITLLDENQKMVNDLASVLKAIPDPFFIGKGTGGAISLASSISGSDKCTYGVFNEIRKALHYQKTDITSNACFFQSEAVSKDAKVLSMSNTNCLTENTRNVWFVFKNENWIMNAKIVLEVVPWVDKKASRGWSQINKKYTIEEISKSSILKPFITKEPIAIAVFQKLEVKYRFQDFLELIPSEKNKVLSDILQKIYTEKPFNKNLANSIRQDAAQYFKETKYLEGINLLEETILENENASALDFNTIAKFYIYTKQFDKAVVALQKAQKLEPANLLVQLNLAHAYMFLENMDSSKDLHKRFRNQNVSPTQTWKNKTINDLDEFKKANLPQDNFSKILRQVD